MSSGGMFGIPGFGGRQQQQQAGPEGESEAPKQEENLPGAQDDLDDESLADLMAGLYSEDESDPGQQQQQQQQQQPAGQQQPPAPDDEDSFFPDPERIAADTNERLKNLRIPDDFNFDELHSDDPATRRKAYQSLQQQSVVQAMQVTLPIMQTAIQAMQKQFEARLTRAMDDTRQGVSESSILMNEVPAYSNPEFKGLIQFLSEKQKKNGVKNPYDRAKAINKILTKMGIDSSAGGSRGSRRDSEPGGTSRTGKDALDMYFPSGR